MHTHTHSLTQSLAHKNLLDLHIKQWTNTSRCNCRQSVNANDSLLLQPPLITWRTQCSTLKRDATLAFFLLLAAQMSPLMGKRKKKSSPLKSVYRKPINKRMAPSDVQCHWQNAVQVISRETLFFFLLLICPTQSNDCDTQLIRLEWVCMYV